MSDISITQHIDAFRNLARRHLEKGSVDGLAALKQTLEMDDKTFAELLKPLLVSETPAVQLQKQQTNPIDDKLISEVISAPPKPPSTTRRPSDQTRKHALRRAFDRITNELPRRWFGKHRHRRPRLQGNFRSTVRQ